MSSRVYLGLVACLLLGACTSEIGDECSTSSDCATTESDRLCLTQALEGFPGGYCTEFNCDPGSCPKEAVCVGYRTELANADECASGSNRLQRSYCMRSCSKDSDCRGGYACVDVSEETVWGAEVIETGSRANKTKICALAYSGPEADDRSADVCRWRASESDAGPPGEPTEAGVVDARAPVPASEAGSPGSGEAGVDSEAGISLDASSELLDAASSRGDSAAPRAPEAGTIVVDSSVEVSDPAEAAAPQVDAAGAVLDASDGSDVVDAAPDAATN
jgi:hypothetical protein